MVNEKLYESLQFELASLVRNITSVTPDKSISSLDRSGFLFLHHIQSEGPASVKALADFFRLDISTASRQARALEDRGYVYRIPNPQDKRSFAYDITEAGLEQFRIYRDFKINRIQMLLKDWDEAELSQFGQYLQKMNKSFLTRDRN